MSQLTVRTTILFQAAGETAAFWDAPVARRKLRNRRTKNMGVARRDDVPSKLYICRCALGELAPGCAPEYTGQTGPRLSLLRASINFKLVLDY